MAELEEPWLRGPIAGVSPLLAPVLYSLQHAREDLAQWTEGLTTEQIWARPHGFGSVGFQLRHIAGSVERLTTCLQGQPLTAEQFAAKAAEMEPGASREELLAAQGKPVDIGGYYLPDDAKCFTAMRPSPTFNAIIDQM